MGFDDEIDQLKKELQTPKLDLAARKSATSALCTTLKDKLQTRRLGFSYEDSDQPALVITHADSKDRLATVVINDDGSLTFQSAPEDDTYEEVGYFPPFVEYYDEAEFLEDVPEMLKQGLAEYELDQEDIA
jgi:hypothetical protein